MGRLSFTTELLARGPAAAVVLDEGQVAAVGEGAKRFPVEATVNGHTWRTSVARMRGEFSVGPHRRVREAAGVTAGDTVEVLLELEAAPREIEVAADLAHALDADPAVRATFDGLAFTHRKEYVRWVEEAERPETRWRRIEQAVHRVREGRTRN